MFRSLLLFVLVVLFASCGNGDQPSTTNTPPAATQQPATEAVATPLPYPPLPESIKQDIFNRCDFVDYIFYDPGLPMSISLNEQNSIRATLNHFGTGQAQKKGECKATGRVMYQSQGEYILEADFYLVSGCVYFVFMQNQKPTYALPMSEKGVGFFTNNIQSAKNSVLKGHPGAQ